MDLQDFLNNVIRRHRHLSTLPDSLSLRPFPGSVDPNSGVVESDGRIYGILKWESRKQSVWKLCS